MRKSKRGGAFYFSALVVIESRAGAAAAKALLGEASLLGVHAALARRRETVRRGVAPRADDLARPPSGSAGAAADRRCASRRWPYASCRRACARRRVVGVAPAPRAVDLGQAAVGPIVLNAYYKWTRRRAPQRSTRERFERRACASRTTDGRFES